MIIDIIIISCILLFIIVVGILSYLSRNPKFSYPEGIKVVGNFSEIEVNGQLITLPKGNYEIRTNLKHLNITRFDDE